MTLIPMCPDKEVEEKNKSKKLSHADVISFPVVFSIAGENPFFPNPSRSGAFRLVRRLQHGFLEKKLAVKITAGRACTPSELQVVRVFQRSYEKCKKYPESLIMETAISRWKPSRRSQRPKTARAP